MKNTLSLCKKAKRFIVLLTYCSILFLPSAVSAQTGSTCATAISIPFGTCIDSFASSDSIVWFSFTPTVADIQVSVFDFYSGNAGANPFNDIMLFSSCSGSPLDTAFYDPPFSYILKAEGLTPSATYFLQMKRKGADTALANICVGVLNTTPCACQPNGYNLSNTCDLICNGGFENTVHCVDDWEETNFACPWYSLNGTSDLMNSNYCGNMIAPGMSVPANIPGNQASYNGGNGYAGFIAYSTDPVVPPDYREYVVQKLASPLQVGQPYKIKFKCSLSDNSGFATTCIGAWLSVTPPVQIGQTLVSGAAPQVVTNGVVTLGQAPGDPWQNFGGNCGNVIGNGEQYITIGNFCNDANSNPTAAAPVLNTVMKRYAYYYLDSVSVEWCGPQVNITATPNPICNGDTVSLLGTTFPSNIFTMSWAGQGLLSNTGNPVNAIPVNNTSGTQTSVYSGVFSFTGLGSPCFAHDTVHVNVLAGPIVSAGNDTTICANQPVTLHGTFTGIAGNESWSVLSGVVLCTACTTFSVSPSTTTSYVFQATNSITGCTDSDTMTIFVNPLPTPHIVAPAGAVTCDYALTFTVTNVPAGASVVWGSNAQVVLVNNQTTYTVDWTNDTADGYVVIAVTDLKECTGYDTVIIPHCCCSHLLPNPIELLAINDNVDSLIAHYPLAAIVSGSNTIITSQNLCISGIFTVNRNLDLKNVSVSMGTNARINVLPGVTFTLEATGNTVPQQTFVHACDKMWDGIYVNSTAVLKVKDGTVIEDGKQAIVSVGGGVFQIQGGGGAGPVKLNKNLIAVWVKPFNGTHTGYIRNAIISCDAPGQSGSTTIIPVTSAGQNLIAPYNTTIGYIGVRIDSVTNITIGDSTQNNYRNVFERTRYGIYATKSNVNTWNNTFKFIQSTYIPTHSNPTPDGVAVYATNLIFGPAHLLTVGRPGTQKATNRFQECSYGVMAENQMNMNCEYNKFDSCFTISIFSQNNTLRTILINADTLHDCTGINIDCYKNNNSTVTITNNAMNQSATVIMSNFGQTGIYVANAMVATTHLLIQNNSIKKMRNGIWVSRVNNAKILDNGPITFIPGQLFTVANPATGIRIEQSVNVKVRNNLVKYTQNATFNQYNKMFGIYIVNCSNDTITKNTIKRMGSGIFLKGSDNPSLLACNKLDTCWYGFNFGKLSAVPTPVSTSFQILFGASQTQTPTGNIWNQCDTDIVGRINPGIKWFRNNSYSPTINMVGGSFVGNATTNLGSVAAHGDSCSNLLLPLAIPAVVQRSYLLEGICKTPRVYDTLAGEFAYNDQVFAYRTLRDNPSWLTLGTADDVYYQNFYSGYSSDPSFVNIVHLADAEDAIEAGDFSQAATDIASIRPKNVPEANRVAVMQVYLQSWAQDTLVLTDEQVAILTPIALEGPISGGIAAFDARNMLGIEVHDSSNLRLAQPQPIPDEISTSYIYPNPTTGQVSIVTDLPEGQNGTLDIYDLMGRRIVSWQMIGGQSVYIFDASILPSGTYIYQVSTINKIITTDRLIMIKEE